MKKIKVYMSLCLVFMMLFSSLTVLAESNKEVEFNAYGFKNEIIQQNEEERLNGYTQSKEMWENFDSATNIALDKVWTVRFSKEIEFDKIDAIAIEKGNQFIPVTITKTNDDSLTVKPVDSFSGSSKYSMRIILSNGKKYKKDFTTVSNNRNADIEPNNSYLSASSLYLNEIINGEITQGDTDFFKVEVPAYGTLNLNLTGYNAKGMEIYLYGEEGTNKSSMKAKTNFTQGGISEGLMPGTYYIRVNTYYSKNTSPYELKVNFVESNFKNDNGTSNYLNANVVDLNSSFTGHIGYFASYQYGNYEDYFKVEVPAYGTLNLNLTGYNGKGMEIYLYGEEGNNKSSMKSKTNFTQGGISEGVMPGTYYIKVSTYYNSDYSPYELDVNFVESNFKNDNGTSNYLHSNEISLNSSLTGHIGYLSSYQYGNYNDYFKVEVPSNGTLDINLTSHNGKALELYIYGSEGNNKSSIKAKTNFTQGGLSSQLTSGTYYIRVSTYYSSDYAPYELNLKFY